MTSWLVLAGLVVLAAGAGFVLGRRRGSVAQGDAGPALPTDAHHLVDLLRRAHRGLAASLVVEAQPPITAKHPRGVDAALAERAEAVARLALSDGLTHVLRDRATTVAVREGDAALAFVFATSEVSEPAIERVIADLRRLGAGFSDAMQRDRRRGQGRLRSPMAAHDSLDSAVAAVCEAVRELTHMPAALVVRDPISGISQVLGLSQGVDRRLMGTSVSPDSAAARAIEEGTPVAGASAGELFGHFLSDRRRRRDHGIAFPIGDGKSHFASLLVFGLPRHIDDEERTDLTALLTDVGPQLGHLVQMRAAETRAMTDELTGLPNRRALHRAMASFQGERVALLCVDVDRFKQLNDRHGHVAGDAALKHLARLFRQRLRERDLAVRMGGEEFALWLPEAPLEEAREVADRVRAAVEGTPCQWNGQSIPLACSIGVAAVPETTSDIANLYAAADAALYRAKEAGRNRVEVALTAQSC